MTRGESTLEGDRDPTTRLRRSDVRPRPQVCRKERGRQPPRTKAEWEDGSGSPGRGAAQPGAPRGGDAGRLESRQGWGPTAGSRPAVRRVAGAQKLPAGPPSRAQKKVQEVSYIVGQWRLCPLQGGRLGPHAVLPASLPPPRLRKALHGSLPQTPCCAVLNLVGCLHLFSFRSDFINLL